MNLSLITKAEDFYKARGYEHVNAPWSVSKEAQLVTAPENTNLFPFKEEYLVASAEQSFIQMMLNEELPQGYLYSTTPCFRDDELDELHHQYFIKTELIYTGIENPFGALNKVMEDAREFFEALSKNVKIAPNDDAGERPGGLVTEDSWDIEVNGIEVGSYGIRRYNHLQWVYGTGCAEPRLSYALAYK